MIRNLRSTHTFYNSVMASFVTVTRQNLLAVKYLGMPMRELLDRKYLP